MHLDRHRLHGLRTYMHHYMFFVPICVRRVPTRPALLVCRHGGHVNFILKSFGTRPNARQAKTASLDEAPFQCHKITETCDFISTPPYIDGNYFHGIKGGWMNTDERDGRKDALFNHMHYKPQVSGREDAYGIDIPL